MSSPEDLLDAVVDRESFMIFVEALASDRKEAEEMERGDPTRYQLGGANYWQNGDISSFLFAALRYFDTKEAQRPEAHPSWEMLAEFLYCGKIIE